MKPHFQGIQVVFLKCHIKYRSLALEETRKKDDSDVVIGVNYGVASFSSWSKPFCSSIQELETPWRWLPFFKGEHLQRERTKWLAPIYISPKGKPLGLHMISWKYLVYWINPGCTRCRMHHISNARKIIHMSTIPPKDGLISEFSWDPG